MATKLGIYQDAARIVADARLASLTDNVELRYAFDDAYEAAVTQVLRESGWRFATETAALAPAAGASLPGFANRFAYPADWLRTISVFVLAGARECPVDIRELGSAIFSNEASLVLRYVSRNGADESRWPTQFASVVAAYLAFLCADRITGDPARAQDAFSLYQARLSEAVQIDAETANPWLASQRDGTFLRAARTVLRLGFWRFSTKTVALTEGGTPITGFARSFAKPSDWLRTHSAFQVVGAREAPVDLREEEASFSTNAETLTLRYTSSAALDARLWPDSFYSAVKAALVSNSATGDARDGAFKEMRAAIEISVATDGMVEDPWLSHQRDGSLLRVATSVLRMGHWRFAMRTAELAPGGTAAAGFSNSFAKPADWLGTQAAFILADARECPVDLREEPAVISANVSKLNIRYTSTVGLTAKVWPDSFYRAVKAALIADAAPAETRDAAFKEVQASVGISLATEGMAEDYWLPAQRDGSFLRAARMVLAAAFWRFSTKTKALSASADPAAGFVNAFPKPSDWIQTQAAFRPTGSREAPVDLREEKSAFYADVPELTIRYTSSDGLDARLWPDSFYAAVRAAISANAASGEARGAAMKEMEAAVAISAATDGMPADAWLDSQRNGTFQRTVRAVLEMGFWRFSTRTVELQPGGTPVSGFLRAFAKPADWVRTQAAFTLVGVKEVPVDLREEDDAFSTNADSLTIRYTSTAALDARAWPDSFYAAVRAAVAANAATPGGEAREAAAKEMQLAITTSLATDGFSPDPWIGSQRDGSFLHAARVVLEMGFWRFSTRTAPLAAGGVPTAGFTNAFVKPADWMRTHSAFLLSDTREIPVALREEGVTFSTDAASLTIRYGSSKALDARLWPDSFYAAVRAALNVNAASGEARAAAYAEMKAAVAASLATDGVPDDPWYRFQRSDAFAQGVEYVLTHGRWRFAVKTVDLAASGTPMTGMSYRYSLPADWLRTINLGTLGRQSDDLTNVDFREEGGALHTDASPVTLRYITKAGVDATAWPEGFRDVVLAYLEYREARDDPARANIAAAKLTLYRERSKAAELKDDQSDRPRVNQLGRFVRGRFGGPYSEQGRRW